MTLYERLMALVARAPTPEEIDRIPHQWAEACRRSGLPVVSAQWSGCGTYILFEVALPRGEG